MEFIYTIDPNAAKPIMLIDRHIGMDDEDGEGIMGDKFCRELMYLDTLGKTGIDIWINSGGGVITDSDQIISAILKSNTKVDTHNIGMCASCAGAIFLAGRNRYMMDYAKFMIHGISGASNNGSAKAFTDAIVTNLTSRSKLDETTARQFMSTETWLNADQCAEYGIATKEESDMFNRPRKPVENSIDAYKELKYLVNKLKNEKKPQMSNKVTNKLKLVDGADESLQIAAIEAIENRATTAEGKVAKIEVENSTLKTDLEKLKDEKTALEAKITEAENKAKEAEEVKNKAEKTAMIADAVKLGKIENKAEAITAFTTKVENMKNEDLKALFEAIPASVKAANIDLGSQDVKSYTAMDINNAMNEKLKNKLKNEIKNN